MDSMRNLHTSLPRSSSRRRRRQQPSTELLQAFKVAALSVTQLYKTAAANEDARTDDSHTAGYQDALDDVLDFLDQNNLGLGDGEGWQVREWATQRLSSGPSGATSGRDTNGGGLSGDSDEEGRHRSTSPATNYKTAPSAGFTHPQQHTAQDTAQQAVERTAATPTTDQTDTRPDIFQFRSGSTMPNFDSDPTSAPADRSRRSPSAVRLEVLAPRNGRHSSSRAGGLGHGAGSKRRIALPDFFDIGGITGFGDKRDGFGGAGGTGKRGRFI